MVRALARRLFSPDVAAAWAGQHLPSLALKPLLGESLRGLGVSLCLHRMADVDRPTDWQPGLNMPPAELDTLIELLLATRPGEASGWLTISFDDGYDDAARYIASRAPRFRDVEFMFFICPEKLENRSGFRWDAAEESMKSGTPRAAAMMLVDAPVNVTTENARAELKVLAEAPDYRLASLEAVRELARLPNVRLGNHTNLHLSATHVPTEQVREDYRRSTETFARLFGTQRDFAFPYGTPKYHFDQRHVDMLRALGNFTIWSTEARPYLLRERRPSAVLPRFPVNGRQSAHEIAGWLAVRSLNFRARGTKHVFSKA